MKKLLHEITSVKSGVAFRNKVENDLNGDCAVIQMKDVSEDTLSITGAPIKISLDVIDPNQIVNDGDLLLVAKGNRNFAIQYQSNEPAVAVALFYVIRTNGDKALSDFLVWYLNSPVVQNYFHAHRRGSSVGNLRVDDVKNLEVPEIDSHKQQLIGSLFSKFMEEKELMRKIMEKRDSYIQNSLTTLVNSSL